MRLTFAALLAICLLGAAPPAPATQHWLVVSDIHLNPFDRDPQPEGPRYDTNWPLLRSALDAMRRAQPNPAVVIVTGDFLAHHWAAKARAAGEKSPADAAVRTMQQIAVAFGQRFPRAQFVVVLGNNDDPCGDYQTSPGAAYLARVARVWAPLVDRNGAAPQFVRDFSALGTYAASLPVPHLQALALDDVYWSILYRSCVPGGDASRAELSALQHMLDAGPPMRTLVVMHIPPGVDSVSTVITHRLIVVPFLREPWNGALLKTLAAARRRIVAVIAGHTHRNAFRTLGGTAMLIAPSISPVYENAPAFLVLDVRRSGTIADFRQYAYDEDADSWGQTIDFDRTYGVKSMDAHSLAIAQQRVAHSAAVRERWVRMQMAGANGGEITHGNWRLFWCAQSTQGRGYARCAGFERRALVLPALAGIAVAAALFALTLLGLRLARHRRS